MAAVAIKTAIIWVQLINVIHSGKKIEQGECTLVVVDNERFAPFSWMRYVVMMSSGYGDLDAEAIRAIKEGLKEKWIPGTVNGQPVSVSYCVPVTYALK